MSLFRLSNPVSPIAVDLGSASVKLLQATVGERPTAIAAAEIRIPDELRSQPLETRLEALGDAIVTAIRTRGFRGRRVACSPASGLMRVQHVQVPTAEEADLGGQVTAMLESALQRAPGSLIVRSRPVLETSRDGQARSEHLAFAMARDDAMRHVDFFRRRGLQLVAMHNEIEAMVHAFDHLHRRAGDEELTTLYVDLGWGATKVAIGHGTETVFAKSIQLGGRHLDQVVAASLRCDLATARSRRIAESLVNAPAPVAAPAAVDTVPAMLRAAIRSAGTEVAADRRTGREPAALGARIPEGTPSAGPDFGEVLESLSDELSACLRYHSALFPGRAIDRAIFLGGEARQIGLCRHLAAALHVHAKAGDPLARMLGAERPAGLPEPEAPHPGWAVACGLLAAPTDL
jgi:Tfp pilus assembly PilM family ATPase